MSKIFFSILFSFLLFSNRDALAQNSLARYSPKNDIKKNDSLPFVLNYLSLASDNNSKKTSISISPDAAFCNTAFFCRQEVKLEKAIKIPVKFRLGSLEQANYYEGKRN